MPQIYRRGRIWVARETGTYGTGLTTAFPGAQYGPNAGFITSTIGAQAGVPGFLIPTLNRDLEPTFHKHESPITVGRRAEDVALVPGRRNNAGTFHVEATPSALAVLLLLLMGTDAITASQSTTTTGAANTANATTLNVSATTAAGTVGQFIWINDGVNSEYVKVATAFSASTTAITITGGGGTGGGLKFTHAATTPVQFGPWTHVFTVNQSGPGASQLEDNWGGASTSLLMTGQILDSMEFNFPVENDADPITATCHWMGRAPSATPVAASPIPSQSLPLDELPMVAGNLATMNSGSFGATDSIVYVPDFKMTISNVAKLVKAVTGSPDPYTTIPTNFHVRGSMDTIFEDYGVFQDYANTNVWNNVAVTFTWALSLLQGNLGAVPASLVIAIQRFGILKANKEVMKDEIVRLPIEEWRGQDYPDFSNQVTLTLKCNLASI